LYLKLKAGDLTVRKGVNMLEMDFPLYMPKLSVMPDYLAEGLGKTPVTVLEAQDYIAVYDSEETLRSIVPNQMLLNRLGLRGVSVTALGDKADFVSRFFAPKFGIPEDPVTGSAHCELAPYWADRLNKNILNAAQVSKRGGEILCRVEREKGRVIISGRAVIFMEGEIYLPL
jgi:PhzF family phenazine biosynthesis protein